MESIEFQYTDSNYTEKGVLKNSTLDLELGKYGIASNDYQLEVSVSSWDREFDKGSLFFSKRICSAAKWASIFQCKRRSKYSY